MMSRSILIKTFLLMSLANSASAAIESESSTKAPEGTITAPANPLLRRKPEIFGIRYNYTTRATEQIPGSVSRSPVTVKSSFLQAHSLSFRYAINEIWSLRISNSYVDNTLLVQKKDQQATATITGFNDIKTQATASLFKNDVHWVEINFGVSLPTASIDQIGPFGRRLSVQQQLGSGTYDFMPSISYTYDHKPVVVTTKSENTYHTGLNSLGYHLGDTWTLSSTVSYLMHPSLTPFLSLKYSDKRLLAGQKPSSSVGGRAKPAEESTDPTLDKTLGKSGSSWESDFGLRSAFFLDSEKIYRANVEIGTPIWHESNSPYALSSQTLWFAGASLSSAF